MTGGYDFVESCAVLVQIVFGVAIIFAVVLLAVKFITWARGKWSVPGPQAKS